MEYGSSRTSWQTVWRRDTDAGYPSDLLQLLPTLVGANYLFETQRGYHDDNNNDNHNENNNDNHNDNNDNTDNNNNGDNSATEQ